MKSSFELSLLESGEIFKKGFASLAANAGKVIACITLIVSALVLFTDISFAELGGKSFTSTLCIMLLASYLMYFSMEDAGERLGEESEEYRSAKEKYIALSSKIEGGKISDLRDFCKSYSAEELEYRRCAYLMRFGYSPEDLISYENGVKFPKKAENVFKKAKKIKPVPLSPKQLLTVEGGGAKSELQSPEHTKLLYMLLKLLPTTLCMLLTVSVALTVKENMNAATVIDGIFKLSSLPIIGFRGYSSGYGYAKHKLPAWLDTKARLIDAFLKMA